MTANVTSPHFNSPFNGYIDCYYAIMVSPNKRIRLEFIEFDVEPSWITVFFSETPNNFTTSVAPIIEGDYSGSMFMPYIVSSSNNLYLK